MKIALEERISRWKGRRATFEIVLADDERHRSTDESWPHARHLSNAKLRVLSRTVRSRRRAVHLARRRLAVVLAGPQHNEMFPPLWV